MFLILELFTFI